MVDEDVGCKSFVKFTLAELKSMLGDFNPVFKRPRMKGKGRNVTYSDKIVDGKLVERKWKEHLAYCKAQHQEKLEWTMILTKWGIKWF